MGFYQAFGRIMSPPSHIVVEGRKQPNIYSRQAQNDKQKVSSILVNPQTS